MIVVYVSEVGTRSTAGRRPLCPRGARSTSGDCEEGLIIMKVAIILVKTIVIIIVIIIRLLIMIVIVIIRAWRSPPVFRACQRQNTRNSCLAVKL